MEVSETGLVVWVPTSAVGDDWSLEVGPLRGPLCNGPQAGRYLDVLHNDDPVDLRSVGDCLVSHIVDLDWGGTARLANILIHPLGSRTYHAALRG